MLARVDSGSRVFFLLPSLLSSPPPSATASEPSLNEVPGHLMGTALLLYRYLFFFLSKRGWPLPDGNIGLRVLRGRCPYAR